MEQMEKKNLEELHPGWKKNQIKASAANPPCSVTHPDPPHPHEGDPPPGFLLGICTHSLFLPQQHQSTVCRVRVSLTTLCGILRLFCSAPLSGWTIWRFSGSQLSGGSCQLTDAMHGPLLAEPRPAEPVPQLEHPGGENTEWIMRFNFFLNVWALL